MKKANGLTVGWLDTSIGSLLRFSRAWLSNFTTVLVTSVDSTTDMHQMREAAEIIQQYPSCRFLGLGLLTPAEELEGIATRFKLFTGFDELWCFDTKPTIAKPPGLSIVSPLNLESDKAPHQLQDWMRESNCKLGLGDGIGLNYAATDEEICNVLASLANDTGLPGGALS